MVFVSPVEKTMSFVDMSMERILHGKFFLADYPFLMVVVDFVYTYDLEFGHESFI